MDLCIATLQLERRVVALRHLDSFITSMFSQVTAIRRGSDECVLCTRKGSATLCIWILLCRINGAICTRRTQASSRIPIRTRWVSPRVQPDIAGLRQRARDGEVSLEEEVETREEERAKGTRAKSSLSNRRPFRRYSSRWGRDEMRCKRRQWKTEACRGLD